MPRTLAQNATYINETIKPAIKSAIEAQGVTVPSTDSFLDYADRIGEIEGGGSGYQLKDLPTGSIATVNDAAELPLNALKVSVEAWQERSGDPSPSNIRPIHGWDSGIINVVSDYSKAKYFNGLKIGIYGYVDLGTLTWTNYKTGGYQSRTTNAKGGDASNVPKCILSNGFIPKKPDAVLQDGEMTISNNDIYLVDTDYPSDAEALKQSLQGVYMIYELYSAVTPSITPEQYATLKNAFNYSENITTLDFPQTIYGAEWDVVNGEMKQTDGYIASYNGETLPSTWISDRDVYDGTNTPTIGAEVVYKLATPTTIDLSPLSIRLLEGTNNLYADCGEVIEGEYFSGSAKGYVDGIKYAGEGDGGIASYTNVKEADELLGATAITFEVYARIDTYVSKTSGAYARLIEFGNSQQTGRLGFLGLASDNDNNLCYWDDTADIASGIEAWTLGDTHLISVAKTTSGSLKIYIDGVLKYTGSSTLNITSSIIDYVALRGIYAQPTNTGRQLNGEVYAWRVYAKELSAANIAQNLAADRSLYAR